MSQVCEDYPLWRDDYDNVTPEIDPALLIAVERAIEAEVDILDWASEEHPEHDPENYTCWSYPEYKQYMRETFCYVPDGFWKWFNMDEMILQLWREYKYDLVYYDGDELRIVDDRWRVCDSSWDIRAWFTSDPMKFYVLQYGNPPVHPLV